MSGDFGFSSFEPNPGLSASAFTEFTDGGGSSLFADSPFIDPSAQFSVDRDVAFDSGDNLGEPTGEVAQTQVPYPAFTEADGSTYDATLQTEDGRRWLTLDDLSRYLQNSGHPELSAADIAAANPDAVQTLNGEPVLEVGEDLVIAPGAAAIAESSGVDVNFGVAPVIGGNVGGPTLFAIVPVDENNLPDVENTKVFYSIPGTPIVGTFKPEDGAMSVGVGTNTRIGPDSKARDALEAIDPDLFGVQVTVADGVDNLTVSNSTRFDSTVVEINNSNGASVNVSGNAGDLIVNANSSDNLTVNAGYGNESITVSGADPVQGLTINNGQYGYGYGSESVLALNAAVHDAAVNGDRGASSVVVNGSAVDGRFNLGDGPNRFFIAADATINRTRVTGGGSDQVRVGGEGGSTAIDLGHNGKQPDTIIFDPTVTGHWFMGDPKHA